MDADLPDARPDRRYRLPVRCVEPLLHTPKLNPGESPSVTREGAYVDP
jgi:hypothetical protein